MGTELARRGFPLESPLFSLRANAEAPELVTSIYRDYLDAGAQELGLNTLGLSAGLELDQKDFRPRVEQRLEQALRCVPTERPPNSSPGPSPQLAASLSLSIEPTALAAQRLLAEIEIVLAAGIHRIRLETIMKIEAVLAHWPRLAKVCRSYRATLDWTLACTTIDPQDWLAALDRLKAFDPDSPLRAIGYNCIAVSHCESRMTALRDALSLYPNFPGLNLTLRPHCSSRGPSQEWNTHALIPRDLLASLDPWLPTFLCPLAHDLRLGVCCGGGPEHIAALCEFSPPAPYCS